MVKEDKSIIFVALLMMSVIFLVPYAILSTNAGFQNILNEKFSNIKSEEMVRNVAFYLNGYTDLDRDFFSEQALRHMKDVKNIVFSLKIITILLMLGLLSSLSYVRGLNLQLTIQKCFRYFNYLAIILFISSIFFSSAFTIFHESMFDNDDWSFYDNDTIVNLYTENFFQAFFIICGMISYATIFLLYLIARSRNKYILQFWDRFSGKKHNQSP